MKVNLFLSTYNEPHEKRALELELCLQRNTDNPLLTVYALNEAPRETILPDVVQNINYNGKRPTYNDFFLEANRLADEDTISIISNSDIYFLTEDVQLICDHLKPNQCYALTRWDIQEQGDPILLDRVDSQDCWVFKGKIKDVDIPYCLGKPGCDNNSLYRLICAGYEVSNPSKSIKSYHLHLSGIHYYTGNDRVDGPYWRLAATEL